jgi:hypothetical protein
MDISVIFTAIITGIATRRPNATKVKAAAGVEIGDVRYTTKTACLISSIRKAPARVVAMGEIRARDEFARGGAR